MEGSRALFKVLLFLSSPVHLSSAVKHTLEYNYTVVTPGNSLTAVGLLDGDEFFSYDNNQKKMISNAEWIKEVKLDSQIPQMETQDIEDNKNWLKDKLANLGGNTLQRVFGCEIHDDNTTGGYDKSIYNGKEFISLNLVTKTWTALDDRAKSFTDDWNPAQRPAASWERFLTGNCIECLKNYRQYTTKKDQGKLTLVYNYTLSTSGSSFNAAVLLNGEEVVYYDNTKKAIQMKESADSCYWQQNPLHPEVQEDWFRYRLNALNNTNQGVNTLQRVYGCEIDDNGATRGYDKSIYNGKDFISLNLDTGTWTAVDDRAQSFTDDWNPGGKNAASWKQFLEITCVTLLKAYIEKKEKGGSSGLSEGKPDGGNTAAIVGGVFGAAAAAVVLFCMTKICACIRSGYVGAQQSSPEL